MYVVGPVPIPRYMVAIVKLLVIGTALVIDWYRFSHHKLVPDSCDPSGTSGELSSFELDLTRMKCYADYVKPCYVGALQL